MTSIWRDPAEDSPNIYPGLSVHDGIQSGSIGVPKTRIPVWAFIGDLVHGGFEAADKSFGLREYGWTAETTGRFLYCLLNVRGEFGRLLLELANAEYREEERDEAALEGHGAVVRIKVFETDPDDAVELPPAWWETPELREPVVAQLRRCPDALSTAEEVGR